MGASAAPGTIVRVSGIEERIRKLLALADSPHEHEAAHVDLGDRRLGHSSPALSRYAS